jgi:hypothetical protein
LLTQAVVFLQDWLEALFKFQLKDLRNLRHQALHGRQLVAYLAQLLLKLPLSLLA